MFSGGASAFCSRKVSCRQKLFHFFLMKKQSMVPAQAIVVQLAADAITSLERPEWTPHFSETVNGNQNAFDRYCFTLTIVLRLRLGQNSRKFSNTVSGRSLRRVLLLQFGHTIHCSFSIAPPPFHTIIFTSSHKVVPNIRYNIAFFDFPQSV